MDNTPNTVEALQEHFSRRASARRIALRRLKLKESPLSFPEKPALPDDFSPLLAESRPMRHASAR